MKVLSLFSGIGAFEKALKNIGIDYELVGFSEIDKYAVTSYCAIHNEDESKNLGDITKIDYSKLPRDIDLITHGSPCFVAGTKILTNEGYKNIENIEVGDIVLTHKNRFKEVLKIGHNENKQLYRLKAQGILETYVTENHPYYVRTMHRVWNNNKRSYDRVFGQPCWKEVKELTKQDFVGINIPMSEKNPFNLDEEECWLLGRYIADGHIRHDKRKNRINSYQYGVVYSIGNKKIDDFKNHLNKYHASIYPHTNSCYRAVINSQKLVEFIEKMNFGKRALNKDIPMFVLNLPKILAKCFLDGYMSGDGCFINNSYKATSISQNLIMKLQLLIAKVYGTSSNINFTIRNKTCVIEGRKVNQHNTYQIQFNKEVKKQNNSYVDLENNIVWYPIKEIEKLDKFETVYNISVDEDNSYTANNAIVHNCQDFSISGKQAGGDKDTGTRSSLMWNTVDIVKYCKPKYVIWENVKNLLSQKHRHNFDSYLEVMENLGYNNYYQVLNAKDYEVPQNRERIYTISIRKDIDKGNFKFPEKQELKLKLKDLLENEVDEKYYLQDYQIENIKKSNFLTNKNRIQDKDYASTLCARDFKDPKCVRIGGIFDTETSTHQAGSIYDKDGLAPTISTCEGGYRQPSIVEESKLTGAYGRNFGSKGKIQNIENSCDTLQAAMGEGGR
jgi:site-specific DNA-cytosine methylase/intein/homing endonuclease